MIPMDDPIYILGAGAIGLPLAAFLTDANRPAVAVRTTTNGVAPSRLAVTVENGGGRVRAAVETVSLSQLPRLDGTIVVAAKAFANRSIADALRDREAPGPIVILQNGIGVERPFVEAGLGPVYRCVLYVTSQPVGEHRFLVRPIAPCPIGPVHGDASRLEWCVELLTTKHLAFRTEADIRQEVWRKAIINSVFNSICPLLDADNGVFAREPVVQGLAREIVRECVQVAARVGIDLAEDELMEGILRISRKSDGQLISTLQDIRAGRPTEMESLNLEIVRIGSSLEPRPLLPRTDLLGRMVLVRSELAQSTRQPAGRGGLSGT